MNRSPWHGICPLTSIDCQLQKSVYIRCLARMTSYVFSRYVARATRSNKDPEAKTSKQHSLGRHTAILHCEKSIGTQQWAFERSSDDEFSDAGQQTSIRSIGHGSRVGRTSRGWRRCACRTEYHACGTQHVSKTLSNTKDVEKTDQPTTLFMTNFRVSPLNPITRTTRPKISMRVVFIAEAYEIEVSGRI